MRHIKVLILFLFSFSDSYSQVRFESYQLPTIGQVDTVLSSNTNSAQVLGSGNNQSFDLSSAASAIATPVKYEAVTSSTYPNANIKTDLGNGLGTIYLEKKQNDLLVRGLSINAGGFPLSFSMSGNLKYLTSPLYANMPLNSSTDKASVYLPGSLIPDSLVNILLAGQLPSGSTATIDSIEIRLNLTSNLSADAYGKVSTPLESNVNCLRVLRDLNFKIGVYPKGKIKVSIVSFPIPEIDIASILLAQAPIPIPSNLKSHLFFAANSKPEIATATLDSAGKSYTSINYRKSSNAISSIGSTLKSDVEISYHNNLASLTSHSHNPKIVTLLNTMGQKVRSFSWNTLDSYIDLNDIESGIYFLSIEENGKDKKVYKLFRP